jgi:hypothetical protein
MIREILAIGVVTALLLPGASPAVEPESSGHLILAADNSKAKETEAQKKRKTREEEARRVVPKDKHKGDKQTAQRRAPAGDKTKGKAADANFGGAQ